MDEKRLQQILEEIAQQDVGEDMDLWPTIRAQINSSANSARRMKTPFTLGRIASIVFALFLVTTAGYAFYLNQYGDNGDPGLVGVSQAELVTPLDLTQTINDVNVTLNWAYADGNRIAVLYSVDYADTLLVPSLSKMTLKDANGNPIPGADYLHGGGGGGGGGEGRVMYGSVASYDGRWVESAPESLDLTLEMTFDGETENANGNSGGSGGGGGGGSSDTSSTPQPTAVLTPVEPFNVSFDFSVPFIPALKFAAPQTVEANGLSMTLENVAIAPSVTLADLCYDLPEDGREWRPRFVISDKTGGGDFIAVTTSSEICGQVAIIALFNTDERPLKITVDRLQAIPADMTSYHEAFKNALETTGFEVNFDITEESFGFSITKFPENIEGDYQETINKLYDEYLYDHINGPWVFTFDVP